MSATVPAHIAQRRAAVAELAAQGKSARAIATRLGVGKDTVRRDLDALAKGGVRQDAPQVSVAQDTAPPVARRAPAKAAHATAGPGGAPDAPPDDAPGGARRRQPAVVPAPGGARQGRRRAPAGARWRVRSAPRRAPAPAAAAQDTGDTLTVELTPALRQHLATLAQAGLSPEEAIARCTGFVAGAVAEMWDLGLTRRGVLPAMKVTSYPDRPLFLPPRPAARAAPPQSPALRLVRPPAPSAADRGPAAGRGPGPLGRPRFYPPHLPAAAVREAP